MKQPGSAAGTESMRIGALILCTWLSAIAPLAQAAQPLQFGLIPFAPPSVLFKRYGPLRDLLAQRLDRSVRLETAADYAAFTARSAQGRYDILWTSPHYALRAVDSGRYELIAVWTEPVTTLLVVREDSPLTHAAQLAGKTIATPPTQALVTQVGWRLLTGHGLQGERAPRLMPRRDHMTARFALLAGEADAALMGDPILRDAQRKGLPLRVIDRAPPVPGAALLVARRLPLALRREIQSTLLSLPHGEAGRVALAATRFPAFRQADVSDLAPLRALSLETPQPVAPTEARP